MMKTKKEANVTFMIEPAVKEKLIEVFGREERDLSSGIRLVLKRFLDERGRRNGDKAV
jgi:hypothetical protein